MVDLLLVTRAAQPAGTDTDGAVTGLPIPGLAALSQDLAAQQGWTVRVEEGAEAGGDAFACAPADVVAVDLDGLGSAGLGLLSALANNHPRSARVALTADRSSELASRAASLAHRVLSAPVSVEVLRAALTDVLRAHRMPTGEHLAAVVGGTRSLPSAPATWVRLHACLADDRAGAAEVAAIVGDDPAMTAKLLQVVNSAYFGLGRTVSSARDAVALLGCDVVRSLVLSFEAFPVDRPTIPGLSPDAIRRHGLSCALLAQRLVPGGRAADDAFTGALLQDVGLWVLAEGCPDRLEDNLRTARARGVSLDEVELATLGVTHAEVGAHLLGLWGLPQAVLDAVAGSHDPIDPLPEVPGPSDAVRIAHLAVHRSGGGAADPTEPPTERELPPLAAAAVRSATRKGPAVLVDERLVHQVGVEPTRA